MTRLPGEGIWVRRGWNRLRSRLKSPGSYSCTAQFGVSPVTPSA